MDDLLVLPCEFRKASFMHAPGRGYWVRLYVLSVYNNGNFETHTFLHQPEWLDNFQLLHEMEIPVSNHSYEILVTDTNCFSEIFQQIEDYVFKSNFDKEC